MAKTRDESETETDGLTGQGGAGAWFRSVLKTAGLDRPGLRAILIGKAPGGGFAVLGCRGFSAVSAASPGSRACCLAEEAFLTEREVVQSGGVGRYGPERPNRVSAVFPLKRNGGVGAALYVESDGAAEGPCSRIGAFRGAAAAMGKELENPGHGDRTFDATVVPRPALELPDGAAMLGRGPAMERCFEELKRVADNDYAVMIAGESGTGKELAARLIHDLGPRRARPFVAVNCSEFPLGLVESELFGHIRGAFTGSVGDRSGMIEEADRGTFFLDEVSELAHAVQVKLLRVIQERRLKPVGSNRFKGFDVRLVSATNRDLRSDVGSGSFRRDLFHRLCQVRIELPPLRDRMEDIPLLLRHFLDKHAAALGLTVSGVTPDALALIRGHPWQGNVRELENVVVETLVRFRPSGFIGVDMVADRLQPPSRSASGPTAAGLGTLAEARTRFEVDFIEQALRAQGWNIAATAKRIGLSRQGLNLKIRRLGLPRSPMEAVWRENDGQDRG